MSGCHEPEKKVNDLLIEFIDNCKESFKKLENLIRLNEDGLMKCFEWIEKLEANYDLRRDTRKDLNDSLSAIQDDYKNKIEKLEAHISKVHDLVNLEDRITACDVLNRLTLLENNCKNGYMYQKGGIDALQERIKSLETHKNYQIDENRKASKRIDEIENGYIQRIGHLGEALHCMSEENEKLRKVPHKCPICEGKGFVFLRYSMTDLHQVECKSCKGKGIVWN